MNLRGFYIFTIITNCTHHIVILRMSPTSIAAVRNLTNIFATFTHVAAAVACHASAELAGPLRRVPAVTGRWAQPAATNPMPFGPPPLCRVLLLPPDAHPTFFPNRPEPPPPPDAHPRPCTVGNKGVILCSQSVNFTSTNGIYPKIEPIQAIICTTATVINNGNEAKQ